MNHFNALRWQDGGAHRSPLFSGEVYSDDYITITYVIKIEHRKENIQVPDSAQWAKVSFTGAGKAHFQMEYDPSPSHRSPVPGGLC